jgi:hypothetical protein
MRVKWKGGVRARHERRQNEMRRESSGEKWRESGRRGECERDLDWSIVEVKMDAYASEDERERDSPTQATP